MTNDDGAGPQKPKTLSTAVVSGGAGAVAGGTGVYAFGLVPSFKDVMSMTVTTRDWMHALTIIGFLILLVLVTGYLLLQRDTKSKTAPVMWVGLSMFCIISFVGFASIVVDNIREPSVTVRAYLGSGSDVGSLEDNPPLKLAAYLNSNKHMVLTTNKSEAKTLSLKDDSDLTVDIDHFPALLRRFEALKSKEIDAKSKEKDAPGVVNLIKKACAYVPASANIHGQCAAWLNEPEG